MKYEIVGLSDQEVRDSRRKYGDNELSPYDTEGFFTKLLANFKDPIIIILCVALVVILIMSLFGLTEWYEAVAIGIAVALATLVSTFSEYKNESSFQKLQEEASQITNLVFRSGQLTQIPINDIVKGDYVFLQAGDKVPADGYVYEGNLKINQASLTGESESVPKFPAPKEHTSDFRDFSSHYDLFRGSVVDEGEGVFRVATVGDHTFYGQLAKDLSSSDDRLSPLQVKLSGLARLISRFGYVAAILIAIAFVFNKAIVLNEFDAGLIAEYFSDYKIFLPDFLNAMVLSIIILVAAVPEGLPMMIAIVLSLNMRKLLSEKVLVRRLLGIETAGSLNLLFSDKTGTITKGQLDPMMFMSSSRTTYRNYMDIPEPFRTLVGFSILENTSSYVSPHGEIVGGNASERALARYVNLDEMHKISKLGAESVRKILFDSKKKFSATQVHAKTLIPVADTSNLTLIKGAPEIVLENCTHFYNEAGEKQVYKHHGEFDDHIDKLADSGIRLIALAASEEPIMEDERLPGNCSLIGIIGIRDDIREESKWSIEEVQRAGIQVVMITGDRQGTAHSIAKEVGLIESPEDVVLVSSELNQKDDDELVELLPHIKVIARALPTDKSRLVRLSKRAGKVVGMTGDGVNDSAALKQSDVGIAMGSGSEVSKEAGDVVILDDNFHSISNAIRYGRTIFKSIRKFVVFQLTVNVAAVTTAFLGPLLGIDFPLTIIQLLWINIIMDTLGAIAFGGEPALVRYMEEPPVNREEHILTRYMTSSILTSGLFITAFSLFFLNFEPFKELFTRNGQPDEAVFMTAFFNIFIFMITINGFNVRTEKLNLFDHIQENKKFLLIMSSILVIQIIFTYIGGNILRTTALQFDEWIIIYAFSLLMIPLDLIRKLLFRAFSGENFKTV